MADDIRERLSQKPDMRKPARGTGHDVQIHAAITICPHKNNVINLGEKDTEIAQFVVQLDARFSPFKEEYVRIAFTGLMQQCLKKMYREGIIRP
jgi:hypothetical protein